MKLLLAQSAGFCFGVQKAVEAAYRTVEQPRSPGDPPVVMLGELIHNRQVVASLNQQGMQTVHAIADIQPGSTVLIRAHGVSPEVLDLLTDKGCSVVDCTCSFVTKIHRIVQRACSQGKGVIIAGTPGHPEVAGIDGHCGNQGHLLTSAEEAQATDFEDKDWILVAQTTFSFAEYQKIREILQKKIAKLQIFDTICITTEDRQKEASEIAKQADLMLVIGSSGSSNTRKLLEICHSQCGWTVLVEDPEQIHALVREHDLRQLTVGVTAGASTPERIIREVIQAMTEQEVKQNELEGREETQQDIQAEVNEQTQETAVDETEQVVEETEAVTETVVEDVAEEATEEETTQALEPEAEQEPAPTEAVEAEEAAAEEEAEPEAATQEPAAEEEAEPETADEEPAAEAVAQTEEEPAAQETDEDETDDSNNGDISFTDFIDNIPQLKRGITVRGTIIRYDNEFVYVDVRDKSEGRIPKHEFDGDPDFDLDEAVATHKEIDVYVRNIRNSDMGKEIVLSKARVDFTKYKGLIEEAFQEKTPISVKIVNVVKDGVIASYGGVDIYVHRTQLEMGIVDDLEPYRGQTMDILVTQFDPDKKRLRVSGSRRALLSLERREKAEELWQTIAVGDEYNGIVRSLTDFGAFVDIGGVDGLVHISELSWQRIRHPSEVVSVGDEIPVRVKDFDPDRKRISLGYKKAEDDPYHDVESRFPVGSIVRGTVVRMFPFGAFVEIAPGVDALCHISQISNVRLNKPDEVLSEGMEIDARVLEVSNDTRRISISIKEVEPINPPGYEDDYF